MSKITFAPRYLIVIAEIISTRWCGTRHHSPLGGNNVNSIRYRSFLLCVALLAAASSVVAQTYPFPAATPNTDVPCSACPGRETLLTIGYPPVLKFVGRWADSETAKE